MVQEWHMCCSVHLKTPSTCSKKWDDLSTPHYSSWILANPKHHGYLKTRLVSNSVRLCSGVLTNSPWKEHSRWKTEEGRRRNRKPRRKKWHRLSAYCVHFMCTVQHLRELVKAQILAVRLGGTWENPFLTSCPGGCCDSVDHILEGKALYHLIPLEAICPSRTVCWIPVFFLRDPIYKKFISVVLWAHQGAPHSHLCGHI